MELDNTKQTTYGKIFGKVLVIESRFYEDLSDNLLAGAKKVLDEKGVDYDVLTVPGSFEIPAAIAFDINGKKKYDGYVTLGIVIRGETSHYDYVCGESARGIQDLAINHNLAIGFGIVTAENKSQAEARCNGSNKDFGGKSAKACLRMLEVKQQLFG